MGELKSGLYLSAPEHQRVRSGSRDEGSSLPLQPLQASQGRAGPGQEAPRHPTPDPLLLEPGEEEDEDEVGIKPPQHVHVFVNALARPLRGVLPRGMPPIGSRGGGGGQRKNSLVHERNKLWH